MNEYINVIETAIKVFPFIAVLIVVPYLYHQYKKYGKVKLSNLIINFSFFLYLLICFSLTVLPLPDYNDVLYSTDPTTDFRIFGFLSDFFNNSGFSLGNPESYSAALNSSWFYIPFFNFLLLLPFGIYQKIVFKNSLLKSSFYAFLFSLLLEIIQLSGLFFIYPKAYRLFQIDDLILNTLGAVVGWIITPQFVVKTPSVRQSTGKSNYQPGVTGGYETRSLDDVKDYVVPERVNEIVDLKTRVLIFLLDLAGFSITTRFIASFLNTQGYTTYLIHDLMIYYLGVIAYYILITIFLEYKTPASLLFGASYKTSRNREPQFFNYLKRVLLVFGITIPLPLVILELISSSIPKTISIPVALLLTFLLLYPVIQIFSKKKPYFENWSGVYLVRPNQDL